MYLAAVLDIYSRRVVGWAMDKHMEQGLVASALQMATAHRQPTEGVLHHSDRGSQYAAHDYQQLLDAHKMTVTMSRKGGCSDNAVMESFWSTLKAGTLWVMCHRRLLLTSRSSTVDLRVRGGVVQSPATPLSPRLRQPRNIRAEIFRIESRVN